ncbi:MAG: hypothetical protein HY908_11820 [Myxococcales bacterium]|nr:hypothetical protein [Myxococcales bacterium]
MRLAELERPAAPAELVPVNQRRVGEEILLTSPFGDWAFVTPAELGALRRGALERGSELWNKLAARGLVRSELDVAEAVAGFWRRRRFVEHGPSHHVVVVTRRGPGPSAAAAPEPASATPADMSASTAEQVVDFALRSTSPELTLALAGGEPLGAMPVVRHLVDHALEKNRAYGKALELVLLTGLAGIADADLDFLVARRVRIVARLDATLFARGAGAGHEAARAAFARDVARVHERYRGLGLDPALYHVEVELVAPPAAWVEGAGAGAALVDALGALGCRSFALSPPEGLDPQSGYLDFHRAGLGRARALGLAGAGPRERHAALFLRQILGREAPSEVAIRSPAASAVGTLAYDCDGRIYTSDTGRRLRDRGDDFFHLGDVATTRYRELMTHETVRALIFASIREAQPDCAACPYAPYCGIEPEQSYALQGSIFGRMRESFACALHKGLQDWLFAELGRGDAAVRAVLDAWSKPELRAHFVHSSVAS